MHIRLEILDVKEARDSGSSDVSFVSRRLYCLGSFEHYGMFPSFIIRSYLSLVVM